MAANAPTLTAPARTARRMAPAGSVRSSRLRALAVPVAVSVVAVAAVVWWALNQQLPPLPSADVALPRMGAALLLYAVATMLRGERWLRLRRDSGHACSRTDAYALTTVGYMGNNALPARAGDVLKAVFTARRSSSATSGAVGTLVAERLLDVAALVGVLVTTLRLPLGVPGWFLVAVGAGVLLVGGAAAMLGRRTAAGQRLQALVVSVLAPTRRLASPVGASLLGLSVVLWLVEGSIYAVLGAVAGLHLSLLDGLYIMALATLVALVPAAPGYVGTFDAAIILGVRLVAGGTQAAALAYAVIVRFTLFVPITLVGLAALIIRYGGIARLRAALAGAGAGLEPHGSAA